MHVCTAPGTCSIPDRVEYGAIYAQGTIGLKYEEIEIDTPSHAYRVIGYVSSTSVPSNIINTQSGEIFIPAYHREENINNGEYLPVTQIADVDDTVAKAPFRNNETITKVIFAGESQLKSIGQRAFLVSGSTGTPSVSRVSKLTGFYIDTGGVLTAGFPASLKTIHKNAFYGCSALTGPILLPSGVIEIGELAFGNATNITEIVIPKSVITMGPKAFDGWGSSTNPYLVQKIILLGRTAVPPPPDWDPNWLGDSSSKIPSKVDVEYSPNTPFTP